MYARPVSNFTIYSPTTSINTSTVGSPVHHHNRTLSHAKLPNSSQFISYQLTRPPSQKKLTITCQKSNNNQNNGNNRELQQNLPQQSGEYYERTQKMMSLKTSNNTTGDLNSQTLQKDLNIIKRQFQSRFAILKIQYSNSMKQYTFRIQQLQKRIYENNKLISMKNKQIQELKVKMNSTNLQKPKIIDDKFMMSRINDLEIKIRAIAQYYQEMKEDQIINIQKLTNKCILFFGNKINNLKIILHKFIQEYRQQAKKIQNKSQNKQKFDKFSQNTAGSNSSINTSLLNERMQYQNGMSFWDDCFFDPNQTLTENYSYLKILSSLKKQPIYVWIDEQAYLRYCDSDSYIFNNQGCRIRLGNYEIKKLIQQNIIFVS